MQRYVFCFALAALGCDDLDTSFDAGVSADGGVASDSGARDSAVPDAGLGIFDAGAPDAGAPDAGASDAGAPDAGAPDAGAPDAGGVDLPRYRSGMNFTATGPGRTNTAANSRTSCPPPSLAATGLPGECAVGASIESLSGGDTLTVRSFAVISAGGAHLTSGEVFDELRAMLVGVPIAIGPTGTASGRVGGWSYTVVLNASGVELSLEGLHTSGCRFPYQRVAVACTATFAWPPPFDPPPSSWGGMSEMGRTRGHEVFVTPTLEPGEYRFTLAGAYLPIMRVRAGYPLVEGTVYGWDVPDCTSRGPGSCTIRLPIRAPIHVVVQRGPTATSWSDYTVTSTGF